MRNERKRIERVNLRAESTRYRVTRRQATPRNPSAYRVILNQIIYTLLTPPGPPSFPLPCPFLFLFLPSSLSFSSIFFFLTPAILHLPFFSLPSPFILLPLPLFLLSLLLFYPLSPSSFSPSPSSFSFLPFSFFLPSFSPPTMSCLAKSSFEHHDSKPKCLSLCLPMPVIATGIKKPAGRCPQGIPETCPRRQKGQGPRAGAGAGEGVGIPAFVRRDWLLQQRVNNTQMEVGFNALLLPLGRPFRSTARKRMATDMAPDDRQWPRGLQADEGKNNISEMRERII